MPRPSSPANPDQLLDRLTRDPGHCTLGELLVQRSEAVAEIRRLRAELERASRAPPSLMAPPPPSRQQAMHNGGDRLLRLNEVCELLGTSRSTVWRWVKEGRLPRPMRLSSGSTRWSSSELARWRSVLHRG